jgi:hypothetical protein
MMKYEDAFEAAKDDNYMLRVAEKLEEEIARLKQGENYHLEDCRECSSGTIFFDDFDGCVLNRSEASRLRNEDYQWLNEVECKNCRGTGKCIIIDRN